jgi:hypothetical protein
LSADELAAKLPDFKPELEKLRSEIAAVQSRIIAPGVILGVRDLGGEPTPVHLLRRGDPLTPGVRVSPGVPGALEAVVGRYSNESSLPSGVTSGNRLALARWVTRAEHPLTARVIVNRIWHHHFGRGIVNTPGNFGAKGAVATHPELLDWLASELVESGWSLKHLHRLIVKSAVYRQTSRISDAQQQADPDIVLYSRFPMRRLDGESIRDALLTVSGRLDETPFGPPDSIVRTAEGEILAGSSSEKQRRSIYLSKMRMRPLTLIEQFDGPEMVPNCLTRTQSTVATQALQLYNSEFVRSSASAFAARTTEQPPVTAERRIQRIYLTAFGRLPNAEELKLAVQDVEQLRDVWGTRVAVDGGRVVEDAQAHTLAWEVFCHAILNSPEFVYID